MRVHEYDPERATPMRCALVALILASVATVAIRLNAQSVTSHLSAGDLPGQNTVSTNELLTPNKALQATERARNYLLAGRVDQARKEVAHALDIFPRCALALHIQGAIHIETGQLEEATEDFRRATEADPALGSAYLGLAMTLIARHRLEDALGPLDRAASLLPGSWLVHFETAITHLGLGNADAALKEINYAERFSKTDPEMRAGAAYVGGMAYSELGEFSRAKELFDAAVALDPTGVYGRLAQKRRERLGTIRTDNSDHN